MELKLLQCSWDPEPPLSRLCRYVNDPLKAVGRAAEFIPDVILIDFDMPTLLGSELSTLLKEALEPRRVPIVFLSGMTDDDHRSIAAISGAVAYLDNPLDAGKLIQTIRGLLQSKPDSFLQGSVRLQKKLSTTERPSRG